MAEATPEVSGENRSILAFGPQAIGVIPPMGRKSGFRKPITPSGRRQGVRLTPQFQRLQAAIKSELTGLGESTTATDPELIAVLEVVGTVADFYRAARSFEGLSFLTDFIGEDMNPDEDFYYSDEAGQPSNESLSQSLYLVMANAKAIDELIRLFGLWQKDPKVKFERGLAPLKQVFSQLHSIRRWGPEDRVKETGLLDLWREDVALVGRSKGSVMVEIELVWGRDQEARSRMEASVRSIVADTDGAIFHNSCVIESVQYHGVLAELPYSQVEIVLHHGPSAIALLTTDSVLFVSKAESMSLSMEQGYEDRGGLQGGDPPSGSPRVALLDGVPLSNHDLLTGRLQIDDPDDRTASYSVAQRCHGTAMASLIIHGDLAQSEESLPSPLHVHPILVPHSVFAATEVAPPQELFIDVIHRAFRRIFGGEEPSAQSVRIVNLSIGEPARPFVRRLSPLARLLDYLAMKLNLLIVVSGGNHGGVTPVIPSGVTSDPEMTAKAVRTFQHETARQRRILSPADSVNALSVGAIHDDGFEGVIPDGIIDPLPRGAIALYSPVGFGFRRSPKPDLHAPGGRSLVQAPVESDSDGNVTLFPTSTQAAGPGLQVAAPTSAGSTSGVLHTCGTSNAAALVSNYAARLLHILEGHVPDEDEPAFPDAQYHPVLVKALLVHAAAWHPDAKAWVKELGATGNQVRGLATQQAGFGILDPSKLGISTPSRVCLVGAGSIGKDQRHSFEFPLPSSLASSRVKRRLTVTLSWFTPTEPTTQQYRVVDLRFQSPRGDLRVTPQEAAHHSNGKGTVLHEVLEGERAAGFAEDAMLRIDVDCRVRVGKLSEPVRYGIAVTLEVAPGLSIDLHQEVKEKLAVVVRDQAKARVGR